jgi:hypothetical protein
VFSFITVNWRGRPLATYRTIAELIAATTTKIGLRIEAEHDTNGYRGSVKINDAELAAVPLGPHEFHGDWNYTSCQLRQSTAIMPTVHNQSCGGALACD